MTPLIEKLMEEVVPPVVTMVLGAAAAWWRLATRYARAERSLRNLVRARLVEMDERVDKIEQRLLKQFEALRDALGKGLHLELDTIREHVRSEVSHLRERVSDLKKMAEDLRLASGDYTEEAELAAFMGKVGEWMERTNTAVGRLEGMLGAASRAVTVPPPKPFSPPRLPR
jgi:hypothetical protein